MQEAWPMRDLRRSGGGESFVFLSVLRHSLRARSCDSRVFHGIPRSSPVGASLPRPQFLGGVKPPLPQASVPPGPARIRFLPSPVPLTGAEPADRFRASWQTGRSCLLALDPGRASFSRREAMVRLPHAGVTAHETSSADCYRHIPSWVARVARQPVFLFGYAPSPIKTRLASKPCHPMFSPGVARVARQPAGRTAEGHVSGLADATRRAEITKISVTRVFASPSADWRTSPRHSQIRV